MFPFNSTAYTVRTLKLKAISKSTIDPRVTFVDELENTVKMPVPVSIARRIKNRLKNVTRFTTFYPCEIAFIDNRIVAMDVPDGKEYHSWKADGKWISRLAVNSPVIPTLDASWQYDGQYVYKFTGAVEPIADTSFGKRVAEVYNLYAFGEKGGRDSLSMSALCFLNPTTGQWAVSSPVTRSSGGLLQLTGDVEEFSADSEFAGTTRDLQRVDRNVYPNLRFVTYAARVISEQFGFQSIEPLGLPLLMIEHRTFNLGGMPTPVQATSPAPFRFTEGLAWMIGMFGQVTTLDQLIAVKSSMKMFLTKGNTNRTSEATKDDGEIDTKKLIDEVRAHLDCAPLIKF